VSAQTNRAGPGNRQRLASSAGLEAAGPACPRLVIEEVGVCVGRDGVEARAVLGAGPLRFRGIASGRSGAPGQSVWELSAAAAVAALQQYLQHYGASQPAPEIRLVDLATATTGIGQPVIHATLKLAHGSFEAYLLGSALVRNDWCSTAVAAVLDGTSRSLGRLARPEPEEIRRRERGDPIGRRVLALNLVDPAASNFRPSGCRSAHDILRFAHEKSIEVMFTVSDVVIEQSPHRARALVTPVPVNISVVDLGGGLALENPDSREVRPEHIVSRPWRALWRGISHPGVSWTREMPASLSDLASVMVRSFTPEGGGMRGLGERSYLLVAAEYMNLNSRLAYHFSLVDACVSDNPAHNYISFRFAGGGATRYRRNLRACFIEACLAHYGFVVDRRGDLVNAWFKKAPAEETEAKLDILGRLMACSGQLDMYMTSQETMRWYVRQFLEGNYSFMVPEEQKPSQA